MVLDRRMDRRVIYRAWQRFYAKSCLPDRVIALRERVIYLEGRMRKMARLPTAKSWAGINNRALQVALGMSLDVHKQLLWGLTSDPGWGVNWREAGGNRSKMTSGRST